MERSTIIAGFGGQGILFAGKVLVFLRHLPAIAPMAGGLANGFAPGLFPLDGFRAGGQVWMSHSARPLKGRMAP